MMKNFDQSVQINHNPNWPYIPDHPYRVLIIGGSRSGKTNVLLNLIKNQRPDIDKIYLYVKNWFKSKYQLLIKGREKVGIEIFKNPKAFLDYSQTTDDVYENLSPKVTELFLRGRKLNISLVFISESYFQLPKTIRLNVTHFIMKIPNKREL